MSFASVTLYKETLSKNQQGPAGKTRRVPTPKWGKTVADVTSRRDLSFGAKVLFDALSQHGKGAEIIALSNVFLAAAIGGERSTVAEGLAALVKAGLIEKFGEPAKHDQIQPYRMLHPSLLRSSRDAVAADPVKSAGKPLLVPCGKCGAKCVARETGWCRKCLGKVELRGEIRREVKGQLAECGVGLGSDAGIVPEETKQTA